MLSALLSVCFKMGMHNTEKKGLPQQDYYPQGSAASSSSTIETGNQLNILDYLQLLWFRRRLIIVITLFVSIIGFIQVNQKTPLYTASSTLMLGVVESQVVDFEQILAQAYFGFESVEVVEVLRSRSLAENVIEELDLLSYEEFNPSLRKPGKESFTFLKYLNPKNWIPSSWMDGITEGMQGEVETELSQEEQEHNTLVRATDIVLSKLSAEALDYSNILTINFESTNPVLAARIANQVPDSYIIGQLQAKFDSAEKTTTWLTEQLADLETKVAESENAVEYYKEERGITKAPGSGILNEELSKVNSQLIVTRAERAAVDARLLQVKRLQESGAESIATANEVLSSPLIQQLRSQEAVITRRHSELSLEYGVLHPKMLQVNAELDDIASQIDFEINKVIQGLENEAEIARTRESSLETSLRAVTEQNSLENRESVQFRALEREATANRVLYETFLNRFKETSSNKGVEATEGRVISAAEVPSSPSYPDKGRSFILSFSLGLVGACGLVLGLHFLNPGLHSPEQIEAELGIHVIGMIPKLSGKAQPYDYLIEKPNSGFVEAINSVKISLKLSDPDANINVIQITSAVPEEGKSSMVLGLAIVMAKEGKKILVVDADLRRSSINKRLSLPTEGAGLTDYLLSAEDSLNNFVFHHEPTGVDFMRTGDAKYANATDIFTSKRMGNVVEKLKKEYDYILFDTPPVMAVADAKVIGQLVDKTLFVVRWDKTPRKVARAALAQLHNSDADIAGIILQQVDLKRYGRLGYGDSGYYYHYGRYGQYYQS